MKYRVIPKPKKKYAHIVSAINIIRYILALSLMFHFLGFWGTAGILLLYSLNFK